MRTRRRLLGGTLLVCAWVGLAAPSPEVQLCLQHLRPAERARAEKILGPLEELPLYRVQLEVDPKEREVTGRVQVQYLAHKQAMRELFLRTTPNAFEGGRVKLSRATLNGQPAVMEHPEPALYRVVLDPPVAPGAAAIVEVELKGKVPRAPPGAGSLAAGQSAQSNNTDHGAFMASPELISLVGIVPQVPVSNDDGEPGPGPTGLGDLALYEPSNVLASVTVPSGWAVHATGVKLGEVPERSGRVRFSFGAGAVRDFPLLASRGYDVITTKVEDIVIESYFAQADEKAGKKVLAMAASAVSELQRRLGPLAHGRLRVVEAPLTGGAGGMEFPGLITVSTGLYRGQESPLEALGVPGSSLKALQGLLQMPGMRGGKLAPTLEPMMEQLLELTVAHEVAHQYFAGLVGSDPVNEPAVDETLAQHTALLFMEWKYGKQVAEELRKTQLAGSYQLFRLMGGEDGAVDRPTNEFSDGLEYSALVYGKGPLLHDEERHLLGDEAFLRGMKAYVDEYRFRWACRDCFTQVLARQNPVHAKSLRLLRRHWWEESHGDEDLGGGSIGALMKQLTGQKLDPQVEKMLEELLPQLLGQ